jgi:hypothetical protein
MVKLLLAVVECANAVNGPVEDTAEQVIVPLKMDGSGTIQIGEPRPE